MLITRRQLLEKGWRGLGAAGILLAGCSSAGPGSEDARWSNAVAWLEDKLPGFMSELHVPGVSVALVRDATIAWTRAFGIKDHRSGVALEADTIFEAQSISKPVFAYRVMKLCELGVLTLDTPLMHYTPDVLLENEPRVEQITARRVLSHTTGLPNWRSDAEPFRINFTPGERWLYSGEGYSYLQSIVSQLTGHVDTTSCRELERGLRVCATDFGDYMAANLLAPFGMTSSGYVWTESIGQRLATPHDGNGQPIERSKNTAINVARYGAAGSLLSTPSDIARFLIEMMTPPAPDLYRLSAESRREMLRPHIRVPDSPVPMSWALGWQIWHLDRGDAVVHGGDLDGMHSLAAFSPERKSAFVVMTNGDRGAELITARLLQHLFEQFV